MEIQKQDVIKKYKSVINNTSINYYRDITDKVINNNDLSILMNDYNNTIAVLNEHEFTTQELLNLYNGFNEYQKAYNKVKRTLSK